MMIQRLIAKCYCSSIRKIFGKARIISLKLSLWLQGVKFGKHLFLEGAVGVGNGFCVEIGSRVRLGNDIYLGTWAGKKGQLKIGHDTYIGRYTIILSRESVIIGRDCLIAPFCHITDNNHIFDDPEKPIKDQGLRTKPVVIEDDVWLGSGVSVLPGITIGKGSIVGARSVVTKDIPPYSIAVGVPARVIKMRGCN